MSFSTRLDPGHLFAAKAVSDAIMAEDEKFEPTVEEEQYAEDESDDIVRPIEVWRYDAETDRLHAYANLLRTCRPEDGSSWQDTASETAAEIAEHVAHGVKVIARAEQGARAMLPFALWRA